MEQSFADIVNTIDDDIAKASEPCRAESPIDELVHGRSTMEALNITPTMDEDADERPRFAMAASTSASPVWYDPKDEVRQVS